jgi:tetratricopeptide (TPR) repeat protein
MRRHCQTVVALLLAVSAALSVAAAPPDEFPEISKLYKQGKRNDALDQLERFLVAHPRDSRARFLKGVILTEQNKPQEAIKVFTALTADFPELPEPYNNLAVLYAQQGELEKARQSLEMAIRTHPSYAIAHENLGDIYAALAKRAYDKALQLDKGSATAKAKLALIRELFPASATASPEPARAAGPAPEVRAPEPPSPAETGKPAEAPQPTAVQAAESNAAAAAAAAAASAAATSKPVERAEAAPPASVRPPAPPSSAVDETKAILQMVEDWTKAWSNNDADGYLTFYAPDFQTPKGEPRARWEAERRERLAKPRKIQVSAEGPRVTLVDASAARVTFRQNYSADGRKTSGRKTLVLTKQGERWLIRQEIVGK